MDRGQTVSDMAQQAIISFPSCEQASIGVAR
jgi:hypothetical protein